MDGTDNAVVKSKYCRGKSGFNGKLTIEYFNEVFIGAVISDPKMLGIALQKNRQPHSTVSTGEVAIKYFKVCEV